MKIIQRTRNRNTPLKVFKEWEENEGKLYEFYNKVEREGK
jgi:hypothetical protein